MTCELQKAVQAISEFKANLATNLVEGLMGPDQHEKRKRSVVNAALGVIEAQSLIVHRVGKGLAAACDLDEKHAIKQVDRLLSNPKFEPALCFGSLVRRLVGQRTEVRIAMDWTHFDNDKQRTLQLSLITSHGRATPLLWRTYLTDDLKGEQTAYEKALLLELKLHLPPSVTQCLIIADRGFGKVNMYDFIKNELGLDFIIRFRSDITVTSQDGRMALGQAWVNRNGSARMLRCAKVTEQQYEVPTVMFVHERSMKDAWCIASSLPDIASGKLKRLYASRWGIESSFRDLKDLHFGLGLSKTHISLPHRRDRLIFIAILAIIILTILGEAGESLGMDRLLKANTVKKRTMSLFNQGCCYYSRLCRGIHKRTTPSLLLGLLNAFYEKMDKLQDITDVLSYV